VKLKVLIEIPYVRLLLGVALLVSSVCSFSSEHVVSGYIVALSQAEKSNISISSDGKNKAASLLMKVYQGDVVSVSEGATLTLKLAKQDFIVNTSNSPYTVSDGQVESSFFSRVVSWAEGIASGAKSNGRAVYAASRGAPAILNVKYLSFKENNLSFLRNLDLEITSGEAPYRVHIASTNGQVIGGQRDINTKAIRLENLGLSPGKFRLVVCDAHDCLSYPVDVYPAKELEEQQNMSSTIIEALSKFEAGDSAYYLQAFQTLNRYRGLSPLVDGILENYEPTL